MQDRLVFLCFQSFIKFLKNLFLDVNLRDVGYFLELVRDERREVQLVVLLLFSLFMDSVLLVEKRKL